MLLPIPSSCHLPTADLPAAVLAQVVESKLIDDGAAARLRQLLARDGRDLASRVAAGERVPLHWFREIYPALDDEHAAAIGYRAGEQARLTSFAALSVPLVSAGSVAEVLHLLRYFPLITSSLTARFVSRADDVVIMLSASSGDPVLDRFPLFYCAAALPRLLRILVGDAPELRIHLAFPLPDAFRAHADVQAGHLQFGAVFHQIVVPQATVAAVCRFSDPVAYQGALQALDAELARLQARDGLVPRLKALLDADARLVSIDDAASRLHLSVSTLKRRLAEAGTGFRAVRDEVLRERALILLADGALPLPAIAATLGYGDLANFAHAFKRWTGLPPGAFRRRAQTRAG